MDFKEEIRKSGVLKSGYSIELDGFGGYAFGVKKILSFGSERLVFSVGKNVRIVVCGKGLAVKSYVDGDIRFVGEVSGAEIER